MVYPHNLRPDIRKTYIRLFFLAIRQGGVLVISYKANVCTNIAGQICKNVH